MLNDVLISMNLPAALEDTTGGGVPASLKEKSAGVIQAGGVEQLEKLVKELPDLLQRNTDLLQEAERRSQAPKGGGKGADADDH